MGRKKKSHKFQKGGSHKPSNEKNYLKTIRDNELFTKYYQGINLVPDGEWEDFYQTLKKPLPVAFRITCYKSQAQQLLHIIRSQFFDRLVTKQSSQDAQDSCVTPASDNSSLQVAQSQPEALSLESVPAPRCLTWYPDELAWQLDLPRKVVRSEEVLSRFHEFLVSETESGNINRQEAVSMIPPLVLDVRPDSRILDMCAAPGSKTAQLIEYLHKDENIRVPSGFVVANDRENKRCYLMVHQVKRLASPCCMIVNHDAVIFPKLRCTPEGEKPQFLLFDRILADVPCSGDGTLRKNVDIWRKWTPVMGCTMHGLQLKILKRGLELLELGGRLVYSTCSMQPVEDEAVIAEMLRKCKGAVELLDILSQLPGLKTVPGLKKWKLLSKMGDWFENMDDVPDSLKSQFSQSMFPPTAEEADKFNLHRCVRVLPHHQDTGAFFIAALHKVGSLPWLHEVSIQKDESSTKTQPVFQEMENNHNPEMMETNLLVQAEAMNIMSQGEGDSIIVTKEEETISPKKEHFDKVHELDDTESELKLKTTDSEVHQSVEDENTTVCGQKRDISPDKSPQQKKKVKVRGHTEDPFIFLRADDPMWNPIRQFYGLPEDFPARQLMYRCEEGVRRSLYFVSKSIHHIVLCNADRIRFVNMGVKAFSRNPSRMTPDCNYRLTQECLGSLREYFAERTVTITREDAITLLTEENPLLEKLAKSTYESLKNIKPGSLVFVYRPQESDPQPACEVTFCGWKGAVSARCFVQRFEREHALCLFGQNIREIKERVQKMDETETANTSPPSSSASNEDQG